MVRKLYISDRDSCFIGKSMVRKCSLTPFKCLFKKWKETSGVEKVTSNFTLPEQILQEVNVRGGNCSCSRCPERVHQSPIRKKKLEQHVRATADDSAHSTHQIYVHFCQLFEEILRHLLVQFRKPLRIGGTWRVLSLESSYPASCSPSWIAGSEVRGCSGVVEPENILYV